MIVHLDSYKNPCKRLSLCENKSALDYDFDEEITGLGNLKNVNCKKCLEKHNKNK